MATRVHGGKALEHRIILASIAKVDADTVREIQKRRNIISM